MKKNNQQQNYKGNTETLELLCKPILVLKLLFNLKKDILNFKF
jgi:hypothetical protein